MSLGRIINFERPFGIGYSSWSRNSLTVDVNVVSILIYEPVSAVLICAPSVISVVHMQGTGLGPITFGV